MRPLNKNFQTKTLNTLTLDCAELSKVCSQITELEVNALSIDSLEKPKQLLEVALGNVQATIGVLVACGYVRPNQIALNELKRMRCAK